MRMSLLALPFCVAALAAPVSAQSAGDLVARGVALRARGRDAEAAELFQRAYAMDASAKALAQLALAEQALGRWVVAEEHLSDALSRRDPWIASHRSVLSRALSVIRTHVGTLDVRSNVAGAELRVDGTLVGTLPLDAPVRLPVGRVEIEVSARGRAPIRRTVVIQGEELARETVDLAPPSTVAPMPAQPHPRSAEQQPSPPPADATPRADSTGSVVAFVTAGALAVGTVVATVWWIDRQSAVDSCHEVGDACENESELGTARTAAAITTLVAGALAIGAAIAGVVLLPGRADATDRSLACSAAGCSISF